MFKFNFEKIYMVDIHGSQRNFFLWREFNDRSNYRTMGLVVQIENNKYIISCSNDLLYCSSIVARYKTSEFSSECYQNYLRKLYYSPETNLTVLCSSQSINFDTEKSQAVFNNTNEKNIQALIYNGCEGKPKQSGEYYAASIINKDNNLVYKAIKVTFLKTTIVQESYTPPFVCYRFTSTYSDNILKYGSPVFDLDQNVIGIIVKIIFKKTNKKKYIGLNVLPTKYIFTLINNFIKVPNYNGYCVLPIELQGLSIVANGDISKTITSKKNKLKQGDILKKINQCIVSRNQTIYDNDLECFLPYNVFYFLNISFTSKVTLTYERNKLENTIEYNPCWLNNFIFPLTCHSYINPISSLPFIEYNKVIFTQLTHELINVAHYCNIKLVNNKVKDYIKTSFNNEKQNVLVLDCIDNDMAKLYNLPQLTDCLQQNKKKIKLNVFTVHKVDNKIVDTFIDMQNLIYLSNIKHIQLVGANNAIIDIQF